MSGLGALTSVAGFLQIYDNPNLASLSGLDALTSVGNELKIHDNPVLWSLSGLGGLTSVGEDVDVYDNTALCEDEVDELVARLTTLGGTVTSSGNDGVCPG